MAYASYITDALVCGAKDSNTADRSFLLFTPDVGMLSATARSVREERSRQRFALQEFALVRVTLIRGRAGWRIGSVESVDNFYARATNKEARGSVVAVLRLLRRFIHGEEAVPELFSFAVSALELLSGDIQQRSFVDKVVQLRLLSQLGYIAQKDIPKALLETPVADIPPLFNETLERRLHKVLEHAVSASHL
jgi:DNA repair protein RecO